MLSPSTIAIIKSTVPVLEIHGTSITKRFYELLFTNHPELLHIFNHANQREGKQSAALANAVYAAATHIDRLEEILPVVKQIGHKHRALGVKPEHYPIVGQNLLQAIRDVLGDSATDEVIQAWGEAYGMIADAFISVEAEMYAESEQQPGGWKDFRKFVVVRKEQESEVITSFYLKPQDNLPIASFLPGQYITVRAQIEGLPTTHLRHYSLSDAPDQDYYRISVKREDAQDSKDAGVVSSYLHKRVEVGSILDISAPAGDFVLNPASVPNLPIVLISGGVGLTPMMSMLNALAAKQSNHAVTFIHAAMNGKMHAFKEDVAKLAATHPSIRSFICYESPLADDVCDLQGYIDLAWFRTIMPSNEAEFYFCGPLPFMRAVYRALKQWGVPAERIHYELFGPASSLEDK